jgi:hypothetical protein
MSAPGPSFYERVLPEAPALARRPPGPELLAEAGWLVGDWLTDAHVYATETTPALDGAVQTMRCRVAFGGHALQMVVGEGEGDATGVGYLYHDPYDGHWVLIEFEPNIVHHVMRAPGWVDGCLTFEGRIRIFDDEAYWRHRLRRISADEWRWENDEQQADGAWRPIDYHHYRRAAPAEA